MMRLVVLFIILALSALLYGFSEWLESQKESLTKVNHKYKSDIYKLQEIPTINTSVEQKIFPHLKHIVTSSDEADKLLIDFFDAHAHKFNFVVDKYLYTKKQTRCMELHYMIPRESKKHLAQFLKLGIANEMIKLQTLQLKKGSLTGTLLLVQPFEKASTHASK